MTVEELIEALEDYPSEAHVHARTEVVRRPLAEVLEGKSRVYERVVLEVDTLVVARFEVTL